MSDPADTQRLVGDVARLGTIALVDLPNATCRVTIGDITTADLPWLAQRAGGTSIWSPPTVGEQCMLICPEGDTDAGVVLLGIFSDANPAPASTDLFLAKFADGAIVSYDPAAHKLTATLPGGGKAAITATGGVAITGDVMITGKLSVSSDAHVGGDASVSGSITASGDVTGQGTSLHTHTHKLVKAGTDTSGPPA